jgi:hypothetical protein
VLETEKAAKLSKLKNILLRVRLMPFVTLIWTPENSKRLDPSHPALNCPVRFPVLQSAATGGRRNANQELEMGAPAALIPGTNFVPVEVWEEMKKNPFIERFIDAQALFVVEPKPLDEGAEATGTTLDYTDASAIKIVMESVDLEWLKTCITRDSRTKVIDACRKRVKEIESSARKMAAAAIAKNQSDE